MRRDRGGGDHKKTHSKGVVHPLTSFFCLAPKTANAGLLYSLAASNQGKNGLNYCQSETYKLDYKVWKSRK